MTDGLFNVLLGSSVSFPGELFKTGGDRYLGFKVEPDDEMTPRFRFTSVAYALRATQADTAQFTRVAGMSVGNSLEAADGDPTGAVFVDNDGNVGIGTSSPASPFHVKRPSQANQVVARIERGETSLALGSENNTHGAIVSDGGLIFRTNWDGGTETDTATLGMAIDEIGNVGIGTTGPDSKLHVLGTLELGQDGIVGGNLRSDGNLIYDAAYSSPGSGDHIFQIGSVTKMVLDNNGNVGIGTKAPSAKLQVGNYDGSYSLVTSSSTVAHKGGLLLSNSAANGGTAWKFSSSFTAPQATNQEQLRLSLVSESDLETELTSVMTIKGDGNVGIGTTSPGAKLTIGDNSGTINFIPGGQTSGYGLDISLTDNGVEYNSTSPIRGHVFSVAGAPKVIVTADGRVGIGKTDPFGQLHVVGKGRGAGAAAIFESGTNETAQINVETNESGTRAEMGAFGDGRGVFFGSNSADDVSFRVGAGTKMIINKAGNVGIGTTDPGVRLSIVDPAGPAIQLRRDASNEWYLTLHSSGSSLGLRAGDNTSAAERVTFSSNGNVGIGTTVPSEKLHVTGKVRATDFVTSSSRTYKKNIRNLTALQAEAALSQMNPVQYQYKSDDLGDQHVGFIAEDVPDLVATPGRKGVSALDLVAVLTKVLQEQ